MKNRYYDDIAKTVSKILGVSALMTQYERNDGVRFIQHDLPFHQSPCEKIITITFAISLNEVQQRELFEAVGIDKPMGNAEIEATIRVSNAP